METGVEKMLKSAQGGGKKKKNLFNIKPGATDKRRGSRRGELNDSNKPKSQRRGWKVEVPGLLGRAILPNVSWWVTTKSRQRGPASDREGLQLKTVSHIKRPTTDGKRAGEAGLKKELSRANYGKAGSI